MDCTGCEGRRALHYIMHHSSRVTHSDYGPSFQTSWWRGCKNLPICLCEGKGSAAQKM
jgi:hypothetical protein